MSYHKNKKSRNPVIREHNLIKEATNTTFISFFLLSLMALRDEFEFNPDQIEKYVDKVEDILDSYNRGYVDLDDLNSAILEETGVNVLGREIKWK